MRARRYKYLRVGDVCLLLDDDNVKAAFHLCVVHEILYSKGGVVRTVAVGYMHNRLCGGGEACKPSPLEVFPVSIQRPVLLCPVEKFKVKADDENLGKKNESDDLENLAADVNSAEENLGDINYSWDDEDLELAVAEETTDQDDNEEDATNLTYAEIDEILSNVRNVTEQYDAEVALNFARGILEPNDNNEASEEEVDIKASEEEVAANKASEEEVDIKASEEVTT